MVSVAGIQQEEARQFFKYARELRELRRLQEPGRFAQKRLLLDEIEGILHNTQQPTLAASCRKILSDFAYVRRLSEDEANERKRLP